MAQYTLASTEGTPIMRPLFFDFWDDADAQGVDDQLMFGPDYLLAPQLQEHATSRSVFLPRLPPLYVWENFFTGEQYNTSHRSLTINVSTPLEGEGLGNFPLFMRTKIPPPPPPPPPAPSPPPCSVCAQGVKGLDAAGHTVLTHFSANSTSDCCSRCHANPECDAYAFGPYRPRKNGGPLSCFLLQGVTVVKRVDPRYRSFGCVRPPCCSS